LTRIGYLRFVFMLVFVSLSTVLWATDTLTLSLESPGLTKPSEKSQPATTTSKTTNKTNAKPPVQNNKVKVGRVGMVQVASAAIYRSKSSNSAKYATVGSNTPLAIIKEEGEWYGVLMSNGQVGWITAKNVRQTDYELLADKAAFDRGKVTSRGNMISRTGTWADDLIRIALETPVARYVYGGTNPNTGMDCSAFVRMIFSKFNVKLPRTAREQAEVGTTVPFDQLQPGDRLYFCCKNSYIDHCGIYAGNGYFIHCSASQNGVGVDKLTSDFFARSLIVAKRS